MKRRTFIAGLGSAAVWPMLARGQQPALPTIGVLDLRPLVAPQGDFIDPFRRGLAEMGFVDGRNVAIEIRSADGHLERLPTLAADLALRRVALIFAPTGIAATAAKSATLTIPVVFSMGGDPVETGLVANLNRPGGNITGVALLGAEIAAKRIELLHKLVPTAQSIAMLSGEADVPYNQAETRDMQSAARSLGVRVLLLHAETDSEIAAAFATLVEQRAGALLIGAAVNLDAGRDQIISLAARHAIPTMFFYNSSVRVGGLLSYGPDASDANRLAGIYAGRILKGEKPANLPVQQPTKFEMVINLKTAKALGLVVPPGVLAIADQVIE